MQLKRFSTLAGRGARLLKRRVIGRLAEFRTPGVLEELEALSHPVARTLASALSRVRARDYGRGNTWADKIERERQKLLGIDTLLSEATQTQGQWDKGITVRAACKASRRREDALLLYSLVAAIRPSHIVELGTNVGISSAYMGAAQADNGSGSLITLDASVGRSSVAQQLHKSLGLNHIDYKVGLFKDTLDAALTQIVDFAFIDGHHDEHATFDYFERIHGHAAPNATFVFDDIRWSKGMEKVWARLQNDARFGIVIDLCGLGLAVLGDSSQHRAPFSTPVLRV